MEAYRFSAGISTPALSCASRANSSFAAQSNPLSAIAEKMPCISSLLRPSPGLENRIILFIVHFLVTLRLVKGVNNRTAAVSAPFVKRNSLFVL